jgi:hypothetical protein
MAPRCAALSELQFGGAAAEIQAFWRSAALIPDVTEPQACEIYAKYRAFTSAASVIATWAVINIIVD